MRKVELPNATNHLKLLLNKLGNPTKWNFQNALYIECIAFNVQKTMQEVFNVLFFFPQAYRIF